MAVGNESTISVRLRVADDGSMILDKFSTSLKKIEDNSTKSASALGLIKWDAVANLGERAISTAEKMYDLAKAAASAANDVERQAKIFDMTTDRYQQYVYAAKMADAESQSLATGIRLLSTKMEEAGKSGSEAETIFRAIGVSIRTSSGQMRPLDDVMGDIAAKFGQWEDGPRKIAIAVALFGRGAMDLIPYLNKGKSGMAEMAEEANRLGQVLNPTLVKKGSELEDQFKKLEGALGTLKTALVLTLAPGGKFGDFFGELSKEIQDFIAKPKNVGFMKFIGGLVTRNFGAAAEGAASLLGWESKSDFNETVERLLASDIEMTKVTRGKPPVLDPFVVRYGQTEAQLKAGRAYADLMGEEFKQRWMQSQYSTGEYSKDFLSAIDQGRASVMDEGGTGAQTGRDWLARKLEEDRIAALKLIEELERLKWVGKEPTDVMDTGGGALYTTEGWITMTVDGVRTLIPMQETLARLSEQYARYMRQAADAARGAGKQTPQEIMAYQTAYEEGMGVGGRRSEVLPDLGQWQLEWDRNRNIERIVTQQRQVGDAWNNVVTGMAGSFNGIFLGAVSNGFKGIGDMLNQAGARWIAQMADIGMQMAMSMLMWGSIGGPTMYKSGGINFGASGGILGSLGKLFGMAEGGTALVRKPTLFMAGEAGAEIAEFTPLSKAGGRGSGVTINNYGTMVQTGPVTTMDNRSFEERVAPAALKAVRMNNKYTNTRTGLAQ